MVSVIASIVTAQLTALQGKMTNLARWGLQRSVWEKGGFACEQTANRMLFVPHVFSSASRVVFRHLALLPRNMPCSLAGVLACTFVHLQLCRLTCH